MKYYKPTDCIVVNIILIASLLDHESADLMSNGLLEELQLVQPQFVER